MCTSFRWQGPQQELEIGRGLIWRRSLGVDAGSNFGVSKYKRFGASIENAGLVAPESFDWRGGDQRRTFTTFQTRTPEVARDQNQDYAY